jgi:hypothetical protein
MDTLLKLQEKLCRLNSEIERLSIELNELKDIHSLSIIEGVSKAGNSSEMDALHELLSATSEARKVLEEQISAEKAWVGSREYKTGIARIVHLENEIEAVFGKCEKECFEILDKLQYIYTLEVEKATLFRKCYPGKPFSNKRDALVQSMERNLANFSTDAKNFHLVND